MKKYWLIWILILIGLTMFLWSQSKSFIPTIKIIGDVENVLTLGTNESEPHIKNNKYFRLEEVLDAAQPRNEEYSFIVVGHDGVMVQLKGTTKEDCVLQFEKEEGWVLIAENYPPSSKIKDVKEIVVIAEGNLGDQGFTIFSQSTNLGHITPGQLYLQSSYRLNDIQGNPTQIVDDKAYNLIAIKERKLLPISSLIEAGQQQVLFGADGTCIPIKGGYLELYENQINYYEPDERLYISDVKGMVSDNSMGSIMDLYYDTLHYLENNQQVLILFLDGLSYKQFKLSTFKDYQVNPVLSVYQPVTNAGFAAMITGKSPKENGVLNREYRELRVGSIFQKAKDLDKETYLVEGDIKILNTEVDPLLHIDTNKNGTIDDEIYEKTLALIEEEPDLLMAHFHSIDDFGHSYGPMHNKTMEQIEAINGYVTELIANWEGFVIITSDHGMHQEKIGGNHGTARYEDMVVPYIVTKGGKYNEE
ncbi:alkaline phosphatase family protein [Vallitalea okinawensis]|uniref:alkaline phosphatase family protein n=1 Tax=Vallitalea okinawensis TaxID=2078660 RepID=UPI000CFC54D0|nr:alkaline phosphatase family protein [Vallitalea okinawensis]